MVERYKRGQRFYALSTSLVVLGGPQRIGIGEYYTVVPTSDGVLDLGGYGGKVIVKRGKSRVIHGASMQVAMKPGEIWTEKEMQYFMRYYPHSNRYAEVIVQECPSCGIDEMIFYGEDYICAWCREMLEDDL